MALKKDALRRDRGGRLARPVEGRRAESKGKMRTYQVKFPELVMERFRVHRESKGLCSAGTRAVMHYREREGLR